MVVMWSLLISLSLLLAGEAKVVPKTEKSLATANVQSDAVKLDRVTSEHDLLQEMLRAKKRGSSEENSSSDEDKIDMGHKAKISDMRDGPAIMRSNEMSEPASLPDSSSTEHSKLVNMSIKIKPRSEDSSMLRASKERSEKKASLVGELLRNLHNKKIETNRSRQNETVTDALKKRLRKLDYGDNHDDMNNTAKINWKIINEGHQTIIIL